MVVRRETDMATSCEEEVFGSECPVR
jgi:hypothetical protein